MIDAPSERTASIIQVEQTESPPPLRPGHIFRRSMRDNSGGILAWGIGFSILIVVVVVLYPILEEGNTLIGVISGLGLLDMVAANYPIDVNALASFPGYLAFEALGWGPTVLAIYLVPQAIGVVMGEEQRGTMDLLLSTPIARWRLLVEKSLAVIASLLCILAIMWLSLVLSTALVPGVSLGLEQASAGIFHIFPISLTFFSMTLLMSVTLHSPRVVGGLAAMFVIGSFFIRSVADSTSESLLDFLRQFSVYSYYSSTGALLDGIRWHVDLPVIGFSVVLMALAVWCFQRRDIGI